MGSLSRVEWNETWCWVVFLWDPGRWVDSLFVAPKHWCWNPGNESYGGLGYLIVPCYALSARYFPFWRVGLGSCRPLPASRAEAWNVHGVAHVVTGPDREALPFDVTVSGKTLNVSTWGQRSASFWNRAALPFRVCGKGGVSPRMLTSRHLWSHNFLGKPPL